MAKISGKYETIFIVNPKLEEAAATAVVDKFKSLVEANGTNVEVEDWGKRRLAYPIEDRTEGVYTLVRFESKPDFPAELDRIYKMRTASCVPSSSAWTTKAVNTNAQ